MKVRVINGSVAGPGFFGRPGDVVEISDPMAVRGLLHRGAIESLEPDQLVEPEFELDTLDPEKPRKPRKKEA